MKSCASEVDKHHRGHGEFACRLFFPENARRLYALKTDEYLPEICTGSVRTCDMITGEQCFVPYKHCLKSVRWTYITTELQTVHLSGPISPYVKASHNVAVAIVSLSEKELNTRSSDASECASSGNEALHENVPKLLIADIE